MRFAHVRDQSGIGSSSDILYSDDEESLEDDGEDEDEVSKHVLRRRNFLLRTINH